MAKFALFMATLMIVIGTACAPTADNPLPSDNTIPDVEDQTPGDDSNPDPGSDPADTPAGISIKGRLTEPPPAPAGAEEPQKIAGSVVVAVSDATRSEYRGTVNENGEFEIAIPESEAGNTFILTILSADGQPLGPVLLATASGTGFTGIKPAGQADLGTIVLPDDPQAAPITPGEDANITDEQVDPNTVARLDPDGVPVGLPSFGKGSESLVAGEEPATGADKDQDGLVDLFDADDDGNGTVDDFEPGANNWQMPPDSDVRVNFFMNLKIPMERSGVYYNGTPDQIDAALAEDTIITLECITEPGATRSIVSAHLLSTPAPAYLPGSTLLARDWTTSQPWAPTNYAFTFNMDRYEAFVVPNAVMQAGDTFTAEIAMSDGSTIVSSRMLNYIFKRIPRIVEYGCPDSQQAFDPATPAGNGTLAHPTPFDGTQNLVVEFAPPEDENGQLLTNLDYSLEFFFYGDHGFPVNNIDVAATWPTPVAGTRPGSTAIDIRAADLTLTADNTYRVTIPMEMFIDAATLRDGTTAAVSIYKLDVAAQCPSGNAAITWALTKQ